MVIGSQVTQGAVNFLTGTISEFVLWPEAKETTRDAISDNIMEHYGLGEYTLPLEVHEDATMAYSLRKLRHGYDGYAIKVRRQSLGANGQTRYIGFDANGDLDVATLQEWAGSETSRSKSGWTSPATATTSFRPT